MSLDSPKVTVLISTFNRPAYLKEAIQSVIDQRFTDWELLIMNDGGVDVGQVVEEFADPRLRYFPDDVNRGAAHRFNFGLKKARGQYVTYLGDDDKFYPNHLEALSQALDSHPEIGLAYSDLYAVSCVKDETTGQRFVLDKRIQVSRDFNRQFMFHYNHVLHVSLMHRKEAAFRVGCFDESVKVLIEWSLNRRLCFVYDFLHVPVATGEYYMPVFKSDRISVVQRKDKDSYHHNLRKIRSNLPPEPWPKVDKLTVIYPVTNWDENVNKMVIDLVDDIDHPFRLMIINNGTGKTEEECWAALGNLAELKNISVKTPRRPLNLLDSYRYGAKKSSADYVFLATSNLNVKTIPKRMFGGLEYLKENPGCDGVKWDVPEEKKTVFDILMDRDLFLKKSDTRKNDNSINVQNVIAYLPSGFKFDAMFTEMKRHFSQGRMQEAYEATKAILAQPKGSPGIQFMVHHLTKVCLKLKKYQEAETTIREMIARGYEPDNYIRLGQVLQAQKRLHDAAAAYQKGLDGYGLKDSDFDNPVFPFNFPKELSAFTALNNMAECYFDLGDRVQAARMFHRASKLRANSHRPFLGFAKLFLAANQLDRAEVALVKLAERDGRKDPETHRVLGKLCERRGRLDIAFGCYLKAFEADPEDEKNIDPLYFAGAALNRWEEVKKVLEQFQEKAPQSVPCLTRLASVHYQLNNYSRAGELAKQGLAIDRSNAVLRSIQHKTEQTMAVESMGLERRWMELAAGQAAI